MKQPHFFPLSHGSRWTSPERVMLHKLGLLPYIPLGSQWPSDPPNPFDLVGSVLPQIGDPQAQLKSFSLWLGIPHQLWTTTVWRWCFELRYRWGAVSPLSLLDEEWRAEIDRAWPVCLEQGSNDPLTEQLAKRGNRPECLVLVANEYAFARSQALLGAAHPLCQPMNQSAFWEYLHERHVGVLGVPGALQFLNVRDDNDYQVLIGRLIYYLLGLENWTAGSTRKRFPELQPAAGLPRGFDASEVMSVGDYSAIAHRFMEKLQLPPQVLLSVVRAWIHYCVSDLAPKQNMRLRIIETASAILECLRPDIHAEYLKQVRLFRKEILQPLIIETVGGRPDPLLWLARATPFRGALEVCPLLNCVFYSEVFRDLDDKGTRPGRGRPAEVSRGRTCAFAVAQFRQHLGVRASVSVPELLKGLKLSRHVEISVAAEQRTGVYALLAPLLAALFGNYITPEQVKRKALTYRDLIGSEEFALGFPGASIPPVRKTSP